MIGNPPWDRFEFEEVHWFADRAREIALEPSGAKRKARMGWGGEGVGGGVGGGGGGGGLGGWGVLAGSLRWRGGVVWGGGRAFVGWGV